MKALVLSSSALPPKCASYLSSLDFEVILMPPYERLQAPVSSHPDMLTFIHGDKYFCTKEYYAIAKDVFNKINHLGYSPIFTDEVPSKKYPNDILFNALTLGDKLFCSQKGASRELVKFANNNNLEIINTKQGYAKCSVCKISENAIITADKGISKLAKSNGIDVLTICEGDVELDGYGYGFIGGASGLFDNTVYFCGDIMKHPDGQRIAEFCMKHKKEYICLSDDKLFDVGTLFLIQKV